MKRCSWCNESNPLYVEYHDLEWGCLNFDERYLFEMLILEGFQAGLTWECILNKRVNFRDCYDNFDVEKVSRYDDEKIAILLANEGIIRNRRKIEASIQNARVFLQIEKEWGSFANYLRSFTSSIPICEVGCVTNELAETISKDLRKRKMRFVGPLIIYAYLQAIGIIVSHEENCFLYKGE